jgi:predicted DNA-binding transcriptional regulator AlpA
MAEDKLLEVEEVAEILGTSEDWLYHHWKQLPFAFKLSRKQLRFSLVGLQAYLEEKRNGKISSKSNISY